MKKSVTGLVINCFFCFTLFSLHAQKESLNIFPDENFSNFQSRFFSDSTFQNNRISFPLTFLKPDTYPRQISKDNWRFNHHLHWNKFDMSDIHFQLIEVVDSNKDKVVHGKLDNGVYENYTFSLNNGKWLLVKLEIPEL